MHEISLGRPTMGARLTMGAAAAALSLAIAACGGGGGSIFGPMGNGGNTSGNGTGTGSTVPNTVPVVVDTGPAAGGGVVNTLFATVTVCMPQSTTACQTIDHVQVDTGSTGLRIFASVLGGALTAAQLPQATDLAGDPLDECAQYADGYSWGTVRSADVQIGSEVAPGLPIQVIGDPAEAPVPASCVSGPSENTVATFGANGILGIGNFIADCGSACVTAILPGFYYGCPAAGSCFAVALPLANQVQNPVSFFAGDNNGVVISLPSAAAPTPTLTGVLTFGIGTQSDNLVGNAQIFSLDPNYGTFNTLYNGASFNSSFADTGSNAYFFTDDTIPICTDQTSFYCPTSTLGLAATFEEQFGDMGTVTFGVGNADADFATNAAALPNLAGPIVSNLSGAFDWGLPFFYGRNVYLAFEGQDLAGVAGPWLAF